MYQTPLSDTSVKVRNRRLPHEAKLAKRALLTRAFHGIISLYIWP
jgi:hypothetical protein